ncbi:hypothetical protein [Streptomyces sp. NRRL S-244]|uniref:hypothetical protein n=1 Tax=Streptomyces sp. NRRL S-244 TaxID=1463897 RepID=UPI0004C1AC3A|nr:hypothetical protein [Streptomyces sp. NRRL S-244]
MLRGAGAAEDSPHPLTTDEEALLREIGRVMVVLPRVIDADMVREQRLPLGGAGAGRTGTCDADARGWNAVLSDAGLARLEQAWPCHLASARRHVFDHLEDADLALLVGALRRIATPPS